MKQIMRLALLSLLIALALSKQLSMDYGFRLSEQKIL
jgi:hypothetical protein